MAILAAGAVGWRACQGQPGDASGHIDGEKVFWDVHDAAKAVVIELADERYTRLVVEVEEPRATVRAIEAAIGRTRGGS